ncbi:MAG: hypothetical protein U0230_06410 [Polyangiales bacterium]
MRQLLVLLLPVVLALVGCDEAAPPPRTSSVGEPPDLDAELRADGAVLVRLLDEDPTRQPLVDVQRAIDDDKPVRASELLLTVALPAARRIAADARRLGVTTEEGAGLRDRTASALDARVAALDAYARALGRGPLEDLVLLDAMRDVRRAEQAIAEAYEADTAARAGRSASGSTGAPP